MIKIGITGSISSGKTTASKIISKGYGPLFSADKTVKHLYSKKIFRRLIANRLNFKVQPNFTTNLKKKILFNKKNLRKIEKIIHPKVRKEMLLFIKRNSGKNYLFFEIPLLVESKLYNLFDTTIFIKCSKKIRLNRYKKNKGNSKLFLFLDKQQLPEKKKMKFCDHIIVNNSSLFVLKKKLINIIKKYE